MGALPRPDYGETFLPGLPGSLYISTCHHVPDNLLARLSLLLDSGGQAVASRHRAGLSDALTSGSSSVPGMWQGPSRYRAQQKLRSA